MGRMTSLRFASILAGFVACSPPSSQPTSSALTSQQRAPPWRERTPVVRRPAYRVQTSAPCPAQEYPEHRPEWQGSPLQSAVAARDLVRVRALAFGAALHEQDNYGGTPLLAAVSPIVPEPGAPSRTAAVREAERSVVGDGTAADKATQRGSYGRRNLVQDSPS